MSDRTFAVINIAGCVAVIAFVILIAIPWAFAVVTHEPYLVIAALVIYVLYLRGERRT